MVYRMRKAYFPAVKGAPAPLREMVNRVIRFEEVDAMGIVWHGHYVSYFEDARVAFGRKYGLSYAAFFENRVLSPIKQLHIDYFLPLTPYL